MVEITVPSLIVSDYERAASIFLPSPPSSLPLTVCDPSKSLSEGGLFPFRVGPQSQGFIASSSGVPFLRFNFGSLADVCWEEQGLLPSHCHLIYCDNLHQPTAHLTPELWWKKR